MKKQSNTVFAQMSTEQMVNLTTLVRETLAPGFNAPKSKSFTTVDMWNIQRQVKRRIQRRFS